MNAPDALTAILTPGPVESRAALAAMAAQGFTAKQTRRARERLGLIVHRVGYGPQTQSTWQLPAPTCSTQVETAPVVPAHRRALSRGKMLSFVKVSEHSARASRVRSVATSGTAQVRNEVRAESLVATEVEQRRIDRRVALFILRGLDRDTAGQLAQSLLQRDRTKGDAWGSCIECQNYVRQQCPVVQQPVAEIHECWLRRHEAP